MRLIAFAFALIAFASPAAARAPTAQPEIVEVQNGKLHLKGLLWLPESCRRCPAVLFSHGRSGSPQQYVRDGLDRRLGPIFARHGYVFLWLYRRGEGLSANQGPFVSDLLDQAQRSGGQAARDRAQARLLETDHLSDEMAGLAFLRRAPRVDPRRVAAVGHSFGGQLALLEAERDPSLRAVVSFGPAAASWANSPLLRAHLIRAVREIAVPVMIIHAANDYSTEPGKVLDGERARLGKPHELKIYRDYGRTNYDGHNFLYADPRIWEDDVFAFLDAQLKAY